MRSARGQQSGGDRLLCARVDVSVDTKQAMANLQFPFEKDAMSAIETYWKKGVDYIQIGIGSICSSEEFDLNIFSQI